MARHVFSVKEKAWPACAEEKAYAGVWRQQAANAVIETAWVWHRRGASLAAEAARLGFKPRLASEWRPEYLSISIAGEKAAKMRHLWHARRRY